MNRFLQEIALNKAIFIIRRHATSAPCTVRGQRRRIGDTDTGEVFEQDGVITVGEDKELKFAASPSCSINPQKTATHEFTCIRIIRQRFSHW